MRSTHATCRWPRMSIRCRHLVGPCGPTARRTRSRGSPDRRLDDPHAFGAEDLVEETGELRVPVQDHAPNSFTPLSPTVRLRVCSVTHAGVWSPGNAEDVHAPRVQVDRDWTDIVRSMIVSTVNTSKAKMPWARDL